MSVGKIHPETLAKYVLSRIGVQDPKVIVGPSVGEDAAIIDLNGHVLVVHSDPITEASERIGWLAIHVVCNDIAVRGAKPKWVLPVIFLPEGCEEKLLDEITLQIDAAAKEVGVMVVGGHTERTPKLKRPLISMTAIGLTKKEKYITTKGAKVGDLVLMTKGAGIEGTYIISTDFKDNLIERGVNENTIDKASKYILEISVVKEALALAEIGVSSMHDPTEGGLIGGLAEISQASKVGIEIWEEKVIIRRETQEICSSLGVDPLKLMGSGSLIASFKPEKEKEIKSKLDALKIPYSIIGEVIEGNEVIVHRKDGTVERISGFVIDEIARLWERLKLRF